MSSSDPKWHEGYSHHIVSGICINISHLNQLLKLHDHFKPIGNDPWLVPQSELCRTSLLTLASNMAIS